jgi:hypothetical protein
MAWYETRACALCEKTIGRKWFFQTKPRLVAAGGDALDAAYVTDERAGTLLRTHVLVCSSCYFNRFGDVQALVARHDAPREGA